MLCRYQLLFSWRTEGKQVNMIMKIRFMFTHVVQEPVSDGSLAVPVLETSLQIIQEALVKLENVWNLEEDVVHKNIVDDVGVLRVLERIHVLLKIKILLNYDELTISADNLR